MSNVLVIFTKLFLDLLNFLFCAYIAFRNKKAHPYLSGELARIELKELLVSFDIGQSLSCLLGGFYP